MPVVCHLLLLLLLMLLLMMMLAKQFVGELIELQRGGGGGGGCMPLTCHGSVRRYVVHAPRSYPAVVYCLCPPAS